MFLAPKARDRMRGGAKDNHKPGRQQENLLFRMNYMRLMRLLAR